MFRVGVIPTGESSMKILEMAGETLLLDLSGALYATAHRTLIVADMHLEKGSAYLVKGVPMPPFDSAASLARLVEVCSRLLPRAIVALGDFFHDGGATERIAPRDIATLNRLIEAHEWIWVLGNHDPKPPAGLGGRPVEDWQIGPLALRHEPRSRAEAEIAGHFHPVASVHAGGRRIRRRCFATDGRRMILPAFGAYTGGLNVLDPAVANLFGCEFRAWMIGAESLYPVSSTRLIPETA